MLLYFFVSFIACIVGAISGIGGGIIIKPVLDAYSDYSLQVVGILSSCTVMTMAIVSLYRNRNSSVQINLGISSWLALGGIFGGLVGNGVLQQLAAVVPQENLIKMLQAGLLIIVCFGVIWYLYVKGRLRTYLVQHFLLCLLIGLLLGGISSFLGIGGGPFNIAVLAICFSMDSKAAALNSIYIIFCSQLTNLAMVLLRQGGEAFLIPELPLMLMGAVIGGYLGSQILKKMSNRHVDFFFSLVLLGVILLNGYNIYRYGMA